MFGIKLWGTTVGNLIFLETLMTRMGLGCGPSLQKERLTFDLDKISWKGLAGYSFSVSDAFKVLNPSGSIVSRC